jgi:peptide-methionine (S)-S-oxide reductase
MTLKTITLGGGCFWCTEAVFVRLQGVVDVESGYCNGHVIHPTYEQVCSGDSGHVEVVRLTYDSEIIQLNELFEIFFTIHDPTTLNRQGNDVGSQYRSGIYTDNQHDLMQAEQFIEQIKQSGVFPSALVTEVKPLSNYSAAESYHQDYFEKNPHQGYCAYVVGPKVAKFQKTFANKLKS